MTLRAQLRSFLRSFLRSMPIGLALVGQLVALLHMGLVRHEVCVEHGDLVDIDSHAAFALASHADLAREGLHDVKLDGAFDDDDHCVAATMSRSFAAHAHPAVVADDARIADVAIADIVARDVDAAPIEVLDVAPKQGPPSLTV